MDAAKSRTIGIKYYFLAYLIAQMNKSYNNYNNKSLDSTKIIAIFKIALSAALYGCMGFLGTKLMQTDMSTSTMLFWRFLIASLWMLIWSFKTFTQLKTSKLFLLRIFLFGGLLYSGCSGFYFLATPLIGTGSAMVVFFSYPLLVLIFAWWFEDRTITWGKLFSILAVIVGLVLLKGSNTSHKVTLMGIFLALLASASYAIYVFTGQYSTKKISSSLLTFLVCCGCTLLFLITSCVTHTFSYPHSFNAWLYAITIGIFATALPIQLMLDGMKIIHSSNAALLSVLEPIVTVLLGAIFLQESFSLLQLSGMVIILISSLTAQII